MGSPESPPYVAHSIAKDGDSRVRCCKRRVAELQRPLYAKLWCSEAGPRQAATLRFDGRLRRLPCGAQLRSDSRDEVRSRGALRALAIGPGLAGRVGPGGPTVRKAQTVPRTVCVHALLLGVSQARRGLPGPGFAPTRVACDENKPSLASRQAAPVRGDLCGDEERRPGVGACSALRELTRRDCLSAVNEVNAASFATRPPALSTAVQSARSGDRHTMSPWRVPPGAMRGTASTGAVFRRQPAMRRKQSSAC